MIGYTINIDPPIFSYQDPLLAQEWPIHDQARISRCAQSQDQVRYAPIPVESSLTPCTAATPRVVPRCVRPTFYR